MKNMFNVTTVLPHNLLQPPLEEAVQGPHSEVVPRAFWRLVSKSCDECKGSFARGCEAKRLSHWTCSSLWTIFQPMRINSVPDVKCVCNNKNVLRAQSMVWHFVRHPAVDRACIQFRLAPELQERKYYVSRWVCVLEFECVQRNRFTEFLVCVSGMCNKAARWHLHRTY